MPNVRKLSPEEVREIEGRVKGQRRLVEEEYDAIMHDYALGDYGEAELGDEEKRITVRNRLRAAAERRDVGLEFRRTRGNVLRFKVVAMGEGTQDAEDEDENEQELVSSDAAPEEAPKRRGRRKKSA